MLRPIVFGFVLIPLVLALYERTEIEKYNFVALITVSTTSFSNRICSGAILNPYQILTTAKCIDGIGFEQINIRIGVSSTFDDSAPSVGVVKIDFLNHQIDNDYRLAILSVRPTIVFNGRANLVNFENLYETAMDEPVEEQNVGDLEMIGWNTPYDHLTTHKIEIVALEKCQKIYGLPQKFCDNIICVGNSECDNEEYDLTKLGDNGSLLVRNGTLVGIVASTSKCPSPKYPAIFVNLTRLADDIRKFL